MAIFLRRFFLCINCIDTQHIVQWRMQSVPWQTNLHVCAWASTHQGTGTIDGNLDHKEEIHRKQYKVHEANHGPYMVECFILFLLFMCKIETLLCKYTQVHSFYIAETSLYCMCIYKEQINNTKPSVLQKRKNGENSIIG
jgi:hypothetical protein